MRMLEAYRSADFVAALAALEVARQAADGFRLDALYVLFAARCRAFIANPVEQDWDGVFVATSK